MNHCRGARWVPQSLESTDCHPVDLGEMLRLSLYMASFERCWQATGNYRHLAIAGCSLENAFAFDVNRMRLLHPKPVRQLTIIFAIENHDIGKFARFERANSVAAVDAVCCVHG